MSLLEVIGLSRTCSATRLERGRTPTPGSVTYGTPRPTRPRAPSASSPTSRPSPSPTAWPAPSPGSRSGERRDARHGRGLRPRRPREDGDGRRRRPGRRHPGAGGGRPPPSRSPCPRPLGLRARPPGRRQHLLRARGRTALDHLRGRRLDPGRPRGRGPGPVAGPGLPGRSRTGPDRRRVGAQAADRPPLRRRTHLPVGHHDGRGRGGHGLGRRRAPPAAGRRRGSGSRRRGAGVPRRGGPAVALPDRRGGRGDLGRRGRPAPRRGAPPGDVGARPTRRGGGPTPGRGDAAPG